MSFKKMTRVAATVVAFFMLVLSFQYNYFGAATSKFYENHQRGSESLVLARIVESRNHGVTSSGGFLGRFSNQNIVDTRSVIVDLQYQVYHENETPNVAYAAYRQSAGFQGYFYYLIDLALSYAKIDKNKRLAVNKFITSALLALLLTVFLYVIAIEIGCFSATVTLLLLAMSQWLVVFSHNLYWMFFLIIAPAVYAAYFLHINNIYKTPINFLYIGSFALVFIKSLAGYEYITTILIASVAPLIFFAVKYQWPAQLFLFRFFAAGLAGLSAFFSAILLHLIQLSIYFGSFDSGCKHLFYTVAKRTHGQPEMVDEEYRRSLESGLLEVILKYWSVKSDNGYAFNLSSIFGVGGWLSFKVVVSCTFVLMLYGLFVTFFRSASEQQKRMQWAIVTTFIFSLFAPLSWYVLAKGHSYVHTQMNHVLWYVTPLIWGFSYIGFLMAQEYKVLKQFLDRKKLPI